MAEQKPPTAAGGNSPVESRADSLIEYPSRFPIKVMGLRHDHFAQTVIEVVRQHDPGFDASGVEMRASSGGKYLSITCTVTATSRPQLDAIYLALTAHPMVKVVL